VFTLKKILLVALTTLVIVGAAGFALSDVNKSKDQAGEFISYGIKPGG
jgi:hypothetical protein